MNKKQGVIIVVLLGLIVCTAILAMKLDNPLLVAENDGKTAVSFNSNEKTATGTELFTTLRTDRSQQRTIATQGLKNLIDDKNTSKESKVDAEKKYIMLTMNTENESKVELALKAKGYADSICSLDESTAKVIVKSAEKLTDKQTREIKSEVLRITKISNIEISTK